MDAVKGDSEGIGPGATGPNDAAASFPAVQAQIAVVTGGGGGIGAAICRQLAAAGATVVIADIALDGARETAASIGSSETTVVQSVDVAAPSQVNALIKEVLSRFGRIDLLVNNAGVVSVASLENASLDDWRRTFAVNVEGAMLTMRAAATAMLRQTPLEQTACRGKIVNISSPAAELGRPLLPAYGASKAALNHLSKSAAVSWADHAIATTIVYPGSVKDAMWPRLASELAAAEGRSAESVIEERIAWMPSGRFQEPTEVARAVLFAANFRGMGLNGRTLWTEPHVSL